MSLRPPPRAVLGPAFAAFIATLLVSPPAFAYVGPGAGLTAIGTMVAVVAVVVLAIAGFVWYPLKRMLRRNHTADQVDTPK